MRSSTDESRYLIIGANGQLGKALKARYPKAGAVDRDELDITDAKAVEAYDWDKVDLILNAAAYTNVDGAQTPEGRLAAWSINGSAAANLARVATKLDLTMVHISSDYVFDGTKAPHREDEAFSPLGVYGQSKAAGDIAVGMVPKHYILRTTWLIGDGPNFVRTMMNVAAKNISPRVVSDQIGRLTFTETLVEAIEALLKKGAEAGTYNLTNGGENASWAEITRTIFAELGRRDLTVTEITTEEYFKDKPQAAPRPLNSEMDTAKIEALGVKLADWREALRDYMARSRAV
jgi:dTDP-4-dehydrorhamnose reductase